MNFFTRRVLSVATLAAFSTFTVSASTQLRAPTAPVKAPRGMVQDWSNQALFYSNPDTPEEAARKGKTSQWRGSYQDPRFVLALMQKLQAQDDALSARSPRKNTPPAPVEPTSSMHRDWSNMLGGPGGKGAAGIYPAKYSFDINATPSCSGDFVVYTTATAGAPDSGVVKQRYNGTFGSGNQSDGQTIVLGLAGPRQVTLTTNGASSSSPNVVVLSNGSGGPKATSLKDAINEWTGTTGITASGIGSSIILTSNSAGPGTISVTHNISNLTQPLTATAGTGTGGQPTIVAFNQLYKGDPLSGGCGAVTATDVYRPAVMFSYNTGTGAIARTSPVISYFDGGKQIAFVQSSSGSVGQLVLLKWANGAPTASTGTPSVPNSVTPANYRTCTAPCMAVMPFANSANDTNSSAFVNYFGDELWVGDDSGNLHKFTGVFSGTPTEVVTGGFPAAVSSNALGSPVFNFAGTVFVGDASGAASGGSLNSVNATSGAVLHSARIAADSGPGVRSAPLIDGSANRAYAFVGADRSTSCSGGPCHAMAQFNTATFNVEGVSPVATSQIGISTAGDVQWSGRFDNAYLTNAQPTGSIYVCAKSATVADRTTLWKIPVTNNTLGAPVAGATVTSGAASCSPMSRVKNGLTNEYLFFSVTANGNATGCTGACVYMFNLANLDGANGTTWGTGNTARAGLSATGGAGGMVIDNVSSTAGSSQLYYGLQSNPGNAIQTSQAALQ
jgi:hypothetical protein